jgi:hypothetical protein
MDNSKAFSLNVHDFKKLGWNGFMVGLAAGLTFLGSNLMSLDLGLTGAVAIPIVTILLNAAVQWAKNNHMADEVIPPPPAPPAE